MKNAEIAKILYEIGDILELKGIQWKPNAYRKAARAIEAMSEDVAEIYEKGGLKALDGIPGVGKGISKKIEEYLKTGKIKEYNKLKKSIPKGLTLIMDIPGMGPKKAKQLYKKLKIKNIKDLEAAAKKHKIAGLEHFKEKSEENILRGIKLLKSSKGRVLLGVALPIAEDLVLQLKKLKEVKEINVAGSIRRGRETIRDIDILITSKNPKPIMDFFTKMKDVKEILAKGATKSSLILNNGIQVDLRVLEEKSYGAALQYFTGSKDHNIKLRQVAIKKGYKLSEYGLFNKKTGKQVAGRTEEEVYKKLRLKYIPPELRENMGEIEAAKKKLPNLIKISDIKGDLHSHTNYSDGVDTIEAMAKKAQSLGYKYLGITDHSPSEPIAGGMDVNELLKRNKEIKKVQRKIKGTKLLIGSEVDILPDGSLDYEDDVLKKLNLVVAAVHRGFKQPKGKMTKRIVKAMSNENVNVLAHPLTRQLLEREPINIDMKRIFEAAKEYNVVLEINSQPKRLDLDFMHVKEAVENGVKIAINTDAHSTDSLEFMRYGILVARKGWCEKKNIINTKNLKDLVKSLKLRL